MVGALIFAAAFELCVWRGETLYTQLPRSVSLGEVPAPLALEVGSLRAVAYQDKPKNDEWRTAFDRIVWGTDIGGPRAILLKVPRETRAGTYTIGELTVRVVDRVLPEPKDRVFYLDLWQHPWAVARWHGSEPFSREHFRQMEPLWKLLGQCGQKVITTTIVPKPWNHQCYDAYGTMIGVREQADGTFLYDYSVFDRYVAFALKCGLGPDIACYSMVPWGERVSWRGADGKEVTRRLKPGTEAFAAYWKPFLKAFAAHLKTKGWCEHTYIALDERSPEDLKTLMTFIGAYGDGLKVSACGNRSPSEYEGPKPDAFSLSIQFVNEEFRDEARRRGQEGKITTTYVCSGPYMPNTFMCSEPSEAYFLAVYQFVAGYSGLLRWAYNSWPENPLCDGSNGNWWSGDAFLVYPDGSPSARLMMLNNGIQAVEKWRILEAAGGCRPRKLRELAARYDLKTAFSTKLSYFTDLRRATDEILNGVD